MCVREVRGSYGFGAPSDEFVFPSAELKVTAGYTAENAQSVIGDAGAMSKWSAGCLLKQHGLQNSPKAFVETCETTSGLFSLLCGVEL